MTERYIVDDAGTLIDMETRTMYDIVEEICPILNELNNENQQIKQTIRDAIHTERTMIGKNVLAQLLESLE